MKIIDMLKVGAGFIALLLGFVGVFLPVWPTTPFIILAVGCFSSCPSIQKRILRIGFVREYYFSYKEKKPISAMTIIFSLLFLWAMLGFSIVMVDIIMVKFLLAFIGVSVSVHILWISRLFKNGCSREVKDEA